MFYNCKTIKEEKKDRRHWLIASVCLLLILPALVFILTLKQDFEESLVCLAFLISSIIKFIWIYWCAYKNPGTKLLTFWLIITPVQYAIEFLRALQGKGDTDTLVGMIIALPLFVWWYILSLQLRHINKNLQVREVIENREKQ